MKTTNDVRSYKGLKTMGPNYAPLRDGGVVDMVKKPDLANGVTASCNKYLVGCNVNPRSFYYRDRGVNYRVGSETRDYRNRTGSRLNRAPTRCCC